MSTTESTENTEDSHRYEAIEKIHREGAKNAKKSRKGVAFLGVLCAFAVKEASIVAAAPSLPSG